MHFHTGANWDISDLSLEIGKGLQSAHRSKEGMQEGKQPLTASGNVWLIQLYNREQK